MENKYKRTRTTVSLLNYHIVFCPRYRRKIFNIPNVEKRFKELTLLKCRELGIDVLAIECHIDHAHLFISDNPQRSIHKTAGLIKGATSKQLREEFAELKQMPSLWTRSYFASTAGNVSAETIEEYVRTQKTRS